MIMHSYCFCILQKDEITENIDYQDELVVRNRLEYFKLF